MINEILNEMPYVYLDCTAVYEMLHAIGYLYRYLLKF